MKKRNVMIVAVVVALSMLTLVAFAGTEAYIGYETFKDVLRNQDSELTAGSGKVAIEVTDNNQEILKVNGTFSGDHTEENMSGNLNIEAGSLVKSLQLFGSNNTMYIFDNDNDNVYYANHTEDDYEKYDHHKGHDEFDKNSEAVLDFFMGDLKSEFNLVNDQDGSQDIEFELTKDEMPAIINLLSSLDHDKGDYSNEYDHSDLDVEAYPLFKEFKEANIELPELTDEVVVEYLSLVLDLNTEKRVEGLSFEMAVSGLDADGQAHDLSVKASFELSETILLEEMPSLDGKTLIELPEEEFEDHRR